MDKAAQLLQANLADIGVDLQIESVTFPGYMDLLKSVETSPDLGLIYAFPSNPDPNAVLFINYDSQFVNNGYNWGNYSNPEVDALVREAQGLSDQAKRCELYAKAQQLIADDFVAINILAPQARRGDRAERRGVGLQRRPPPDRERLGHQRRVLIPAEPR